MSIFRKRVSVLIIHEQKILGFKAVDPVSGRSYIFLPGGAPEMGESLQATAVREVLEETGYQIKILKIPEVVSRYIFEWNGSSYDCETHYFAGSLLSTEARDVNDASYHRGVVWTELKDIDQTFDYHPEILKVIKQFLLTLNQRDL